MVAQPAAVDPRQIYVLAGEAARRVRARHDARAAESDWRTWLETLYRGYISRGFAPYHEEFWAWVWALEQGVRARPFVGLWPRGYAKSTSAELACAAVAARRTRRYGLYISETQEQADDHVANVAGMLESPAFELAYPEAAARKVGKYGNSRGWRRNRLRTASGFTLDAIGLDTAARGVKLDEDRPDLLCHRRGTVIRDGGDWIPVEAHPGVLGTRHEEGFSVRVWGVPSEEVVTRDHRYWAIRLHDGKQEGDASWVDAVELAQLRQAPGRGAAIGWKIPSVEKEPEPIVVGMSRLRRLTDAGPVVDEVLHVATPQELHDAEWWWLIGLWWGDGTVSAGGGNQHAVSIAVADTQPEIAERIETILSRWGYGWSTRQATGCRHIVFSCKWAFLWFLHHWRRLDPDGAYRAGQKRPPVWVEAMGRDHQAALLRGYFDADGYVEGNEVRLTSVSLVGLLSARRMLARLGVPASVRKGPNTSTTERVINGLACRVQPKWDLRIRHRADALGFDVRPIERNSRPSRVWIADGFLWSSVRAVEPTDGPEEFVPIRTVSGVYETAFGDSHNCFDDLDGKLDSAATTERKLTTLTHTLLPAGSDAPAVLAIQNLVIPDGIFARLADGRADFLADRIVSGPHPAVRNLTTEQRDGRTVVTGGEPTWPAMGLDVAQAEIDEMGLTAYRAEKQHDVEAPAGGLFDHLDFRHCRWDEVPDLVRIVVWVDPAVTDTDQSDSHAIQADGIAPDGTIYRLWSWEDRTSPEDSLRRAIRKAVELGAECVGVETDQGGDTWASVYREAARAVLGDARPPAFRQAKAGAGHGPKVERASRMLADYERALMVHVTGTHETLERALRRFPRTKPLDLVDASYWSWFDLRGKRVEPVVAPGSVAGNTLFGPSDGGDDAGWWAE